ncbi:hypothetical protein [Billgrantia montanilacus]|uniref:Uncharacterized protein n=1 Tax=Billgrantia montanilacus TaxID=2282305 RepID=A0A368TWK6_9GAMM|nr:hypothetical protein [Halomonas montanilacus]RCV87483.1 hypothetical protein DU505_17070 [Halomonas montanilacus]
MDWSYFRKEPDAFSLKRLPAVTKPVRIKDVTDLDDYRSDFRNLSFSEGVDWYQRWIDFYEIETDTFDEAADRASAPFLAEMAPFKGHMEEAAWLMEDSEPIELGLSAPAIKKAEASGLITGDADNGYQAGPEMASAFTKLIQRMMDGVHESIRDMPEPYQETVWHELVMWDGLPGPLGRQAIREYGGSIGQRVAEKAQAEADSHAPGSKRGDPSSPVNGFNKTGSPGVTRQPTAAKPTIPLYRRPGAWGFVAILIWWFFLR